MKYSIAQFLRLISLTIIAVCVIQNAQAKEEKIPSWYSQPKQNNSSNLYGVAEGYSLEESTKYALAEAAARLMVSISSESTLTREENSAGFNEEMRQQARQSVEKIEFTNFKVTRSENIGPKFYTEVEIERDSFLRDQHERVEFIEKQIKDLDQGSIGKNTISRRNALLKIADLSKELEVKSRILAGAGQNINLKEKLNSIANYKNQLNAFSDKIEFYFDIKSPPAIAKVIRNALNKEKIKIASNRNAGNKNQVVIRVSSESKSNQVYEAYMTKVEIDFENLVDNKLAASNTVEVTGSSVIGEKESYLAAIKSLEEKIAADGIMKILGLY